MNKIYNVGLYFCALFIFLISLFIEGVLLFFSYVPILVSSYSERLNLDTYSILLFVGINFFWFSYSTYRLVQKKFEKKYVLNMYFKNIVVSMVSILLSFLAFGILN